MKNYYIFTSPEVLELEFRGNEVKFAGQWIEKQDLIKQLQNLLKYLERSNGK